MSVERGRESYRRRAWRDAYESLSRADKAAPLAVEDLERLAVCAFLIGSDDEYLRALDRAHHACLDIGESARAARCAFWLGLRLLLRGVTGPATGWLARAQRLVDREGRDCVEGGYLLLPAAEQRLDAADWEAAHAIAARAAEIGDRFGDADLVACARHLQGRALVQQGRVEAGLALLDEAMVSVAAGELSPIVTGLIYCSVIDSCQRVYASSRARQWTAALARWCSEQPDMVAFTGACLVHRAEIMQLQGAWGDALEEARRACERFSQGIDQEPPGAALYQQAEVHRLRGEVAAAEDVYREASRWGREPQPGLALLRLAQGRTDAAVAAIRRVASATTDRLERARLLPAYVEIALAAGDVQGARGACRELEETAERFGTSVLGAMAAHARGAIELADGDARAAIGPLRRAWQTWHQIEAPYLAARVRELAGLACRALGDDDGARLELEAARAVFERLGAAPDLARVDSLIENARPARHYLVTTHRVIAPDLPGHGASEVTDGPLDADRVSAWLGELIERTCPGRPALVGQLLGGAVATRFATDRGHRLDRLVLVDAFGLAPFQPAPEFGRVLADFVAQPTAETHDRLWRQCAFDLDRLRDRMGERWDRLKAYNLDRANAEGLKAAQRSLMEEFGMPAVPPADLARIAVPTTLIWGRHDRATPLAVAEAASARYGWPLHVVENAADDPPVEQPEAFLGALRVSIGGARAGGASMPVR